MASTPVSEPFPRPTRLAVPSGASAAFLGLGAVAIGVYYLLPARSQDVLYLVIGAVSVAVVAVAARRMQHGRTAWTLFAGGVFCAVVGDAISTYYELHLGKEPPVPSAADVAYLAMYPFLLVGLYLLLRELGTLASSSAVFDALIVTVAFGTVQWVFFFDPTYHSGQSIFARAVEMAYPTMDLLVLVALVQLVLSVKWPAVSYQLLIAAVTLWVVGDEIFGLSADNYVAGGWIDTFWLASYVLWGAAALDPSASRPSPREPREVPRVTSARLAVLAGCLLTIPAVLLIEHVWPRRTIHAGAIAIGGALLAVLVVVRFANRVRAVDSARMAERDANERLRELDRMKDEFVATISHELRTPLQSIIGYVELAREQADAEERSYLAIVDRNATRLLALVSDLLFVARIQSGGVDVEFADVELDELAADCVGAAQPQATAADVTLRVETNGGELHVRGDRRKLAQVIDNLVLNAIKFSPNGGEVTVSVRRSANGDACVEVSDQGIGIPEDELDRIFERFFRSSNARSRQIPGTGLGLYISNSIVLAHGGSMTVRTAEHDGSTFVVNLPVAA